LFSPDSREGSLDLFAEIAGIQGSIAILKTPLGIIFIKAFTGNHPRCLFAQANCGGQNLAYRQRF
jgi:hypothetical protein